MPLTVYINLYKYLCNWGACLPVLLADGSLLFPCFGLEEEEGVQLRGRGAESRPAALPLGRVGSRYGSARRPCSVSPCWLGELAHHVHRNSDTDGPSVLSLSVPWCCRGSWSRCPVRSRVTMIYQSC